jgi:ParB family chromosome partitioning protein
MAKQALAGTRLNAFSMDPNKLTIIGLDTDDGPEHPLYDERIHLPVKEGLVRNIMLNGVIQNVVVRKNGDTVEVVDGRQRVRAAREANERLAAEGKELVHVPTSVRRGKDHALFGVTISANENRYDDDVMVKAEKCQRYMDMGRSEDEAAVQFGVDAKTVKMWQKLLELSPRVKKAVAAGQISASAAVSLAKMTHEQQDAQLEEAIAEGRTSVTAVKQGVRVRRKTEKGEEATTAPGKRLLRALWKQHRAKEIVLDETVAKVLGWVLGDVKPERIAGLTSAINAALGEDTDADEEE